MTPDALAVGDEAREPRPARRTAPSRRAAPGQAARAGRRPRARSGRRARPSGHQSSSSSSEGQRDRASAWPAARARRAPSAARSRGRRAARRTAGRPPARAARKAPPSTSLRSAAQATDSTRSGCSAKRAATAALRQSAPVSAAQHRQQQHGVGGVQRRARRGGAPRPQAEELDVEHVGEPGQRVPVRGVVAEGPAEPAPREPGGHRRVVEDVGVIVVGDEFVEERLAVDDADGQDEDQSERQEATVEAKPGPGRNRSRSRRGVRRRRRGIQRRSLR